MKTETLKMTIKRIFIVAIVGIALTALAGCGISQVPYRHGYNGRNYHNNADYYRGGYGYFGNSSDAPEYNPDNSGYGPMMGYGPGRSGSCTW